MGRGRIKGTRLSEEERVGSVRVIALGCLCRGYQQTATGLPTQLPAPRRGVPSVHAEVQHYVRSSFVLRGYVEGAEKGICCSWISAATKEPIGEQGSAGR